MTQQLINDLADENVRLREGWEREVERLRAALEPFALAARAHGVRRGKDDLWVSLGVASSAWVAAVAALSEES